MEHSEIKLSASVTAQIDNNGVVILRDNHPLSDDESRFALDATEAWNLLEWLADYHRDRLYQLSQHGKQTESEEHLLSDQ